MPRTSTASDVSDRFYGSRFGQEWEFYISARLHYSQWRVCVCVGHILNNPVVQQL